MASVRKKITNILVLAKMFFIPFKHQLPMVVLNGIGIPLAMMIFLSLMTSGENAYKVSILVGSLISGIVSLVIGTMSSRINNFKVGAGLEFFLAEGITRFEFLAGILIAHLMIFVPANSLVLIVGIKFLLKTSLNWKLILYPILFGLSVFSLIWAGVVIGFKSRTFADAQSYSSLLQFMLILLSPVYFSPGNLPQLLRGISYTLPTTAMNYSIRFLLARDLANIEHYTYLAPLLLLVWGAIGVMIVAKHCPWNIEM